MIKKILAYLVLACLVSPPIFADPGYGGNSGYRKINGAADVSTNTSSFNGVLSSADTTVQLALNTLDNLTAGAGDVTGSGDCASGACGDGTSDGGTYYRLYDGDSHYGELKTANLSGNRTYTFPNFDATVASLAGTETLTNKTLAAADNVIEADTGDSATSFFSSGTLEDARLPSSMADKVFTGSAQIPNGASPTVDAAGEVAVDTTNDQFIYYGGAKRVLPYEDQACFTVQTPVTGDDNVPLNSPKYAIAITSIYCRTQGGTSATIHLSDGTNDTEDIVCDSDGQADDGSIANGTFTARERMEYDTVAVSGSVDWVNVCYEYTTTAT